ncbi:MAG: 3-deoxy-manno-octulosonate cytidylyltransferase [Candidatus Aminicenantia bacterium]
MRKAVGIIPARYHSTRFPGKPLANILGQPMVQMVYEKALRAKFLAEVIVATDDVRIEKEIKKFGGKVFLTSSLHRTGTERVAEVATHIKSDIILNIQGDEPLLEPSMLDDLVSVLQDEKIQIATLVEKETDLNLINNSNVVKVVIDNNNFALYFSRSPIPYQAQDYFYKHIGIYGFQRNFLLNFVQYSPSSLEKTEKLEQLRALEYGVRIKIVCSKYSTFSVDTEEDLDRVIEILKKKENG